jgi:hypothetical protein
VGDFSVPVRLSGDHHPEFRVVVLAEGAPVEVTPKRVKEVAEAEEEVAAEAEDIDAEMAEAVAAEEAEA